MHRREGRCLPRISLTASDPAKFWQFYLQLFDVRAAFKTLECDLVIRLIFHEEEGRVEAHILIAFLAYGIPVTLGQQLKTPTPGLTPRAVLAKFAAVQMIDIYMPATDRWEG